MGRRECCLPAIEQCPNTMSHPIEIEVIDRATKTPFEERVYGGFWVRLIYTSSFGRWLAPRIARWPLISKLYGLWQRQRLTRGKIAPFVERFGIDEGEFLKPLEAFQSFNDFFVRELRPQARPISSTPRAAIIPADGRYKFFEGIGPEIALFVKGNELFLGDLLSGFANVRDYLGGTLILGRLCPLDCHRFYSPSRAQIGSPHTFEGLLYSVNPLATSQNGAILARNRKTILSLNSEDFGQFLLIAIGATCVGTVHLTYPRGSFVERGQELGYYSFGGSALIALFRPGTLQLAGDLQRLSAQPREIYCKIGQDLGVAQSRDRP